MGISTIVSILSINIAINVNNRNIDIKPLRIFIDGVTIGGTTLHCHFGSENANLFTKFANTRKRRRRVIKSLTNLLSIPNANAILKQATRCGSGRECVCVSACACAMLAERKTQQRESAALLLWSRYDLATDTIFKQRPKQ